MTTKVSKSLSTIVKIGILGALAGAVMLIEFPLPFIAPPFYAMDFSEVIVLLGGFALGPLPAIAIEAVKIAVNLLMKGSYTFGIGELANFIIGCAFVLPAILIYQKARSRKGAIIGMSVGTVMIVVIGCLINAYVMLPFYSTAGGIPLDKIIAMGSDVNKNINSVMTLVVLSVAPFNLLKGLVVSLITGLSYKKLSPFLKRNFNF